MLEIIFICIFRQAGTEDKTESRKYQKQYEDMVRNFEERGSIIIFFVLFFFIKHFK